MDKEPKNNEGYKLILIEDLNVSIDNTDSDFIPTDIILKSINEQNGFWNLKSSIFDRHKNISYGEFSHSTKKVKYEYLPIFI